MMHQKRLYQTCCGNGEFSSDAITPVIFWIQSFWSAPDSACHKQSENHSHLWHPYIEEVWKKYIEKMLFTCFWNTENMHCTKKVQQLKTNSAVTCNVNVLMGEIILKQNLKSFSSASTLIVEVLRSIVWHDSESSPWDEALWFKNLNRPKTPAPSPAVCCDATPCFQQNKRIRYTQSTEQIT